jgi:LemA protein
MIRNRLMLAIMAPVLLLVSACGINSIPTAEEKAKAEWADVQANFQRRANLIPNLVETVRGASTSEERILTNVTQARAAATQIQLTPDQLSDPEAMRRFSEAQGRLASAIIPLRQLQEAYPNLQSQANYGTLMSQLEGTENRISIAIQDYNQAVQAYNTTIRTFPSVIGARVFYGSRPMTPYQSVTPGAEVAPSVNFGNRQ